MKHWHENRRVGIGLSRHLGNTNTSEDISKALVASSVDWDLVTEDTRFLEPAVGAGSFCFAMADKLLEKGFSVETVFGRQITVCDVDVHALNRFRENLLSRYGQQALDCAQIHHEDFLTSSRHNAGYDIIVTNPPYVSDRNLTPPHGQDKDDWLKAIRSHLTQEVPPRADLYMFFHVRCLELLRRGGRCVFLCSDSWIDSEFGMALKTMVLDGDWTLETLLNSQWMPFFRDDTNAVLTNIRRLNPGETKSPTRVTNLRITDWNMADHAPSVLIAPEDMRTLLTSPDIPNKRNALLLFGEEYAEIENLLDNHHDAFTPVDQLFEVKTSPIGASAFAKDKQGRARRGPIPVFWQLQARTNRPPDYRTRIPADDLPLWVGEEECTVKGKRLDPLDKVVYLSTIVDRFPLAFHSDRPTLHVNKYFALLPKDKEMTPHRAAALVQSVFSVLFLEQRTKEGTRKTLRKGECGLAKEMSKGDLLTCLVPKAEALDGLDEAIHAYQGRVLYNLEDALKDPDYWSVQEGIARSLGLTQDLPKITRMAVFLYVLRMRHLQKLSNFDAWWRDTHANRLFSNPT